MGGGCMGGRLTTGAPDPSLEASRPWKKLLPRDCCRLACMLGGLGIMEGEGEAPWWCPASWIGEALGMGSRP
eukprot:87129-Pelagomonas_calceolata.AAC.1